MKTKLTLLMMAIIFSSCERGCQRFDKQFQTGKRNYIIEQYSGGELIRKYQFRGIVNDSEGSDGYYFTIGDTLIEVSGDLTIKSTN